MTTHRPKTIVVFVVGLALLACPAAARAGKTPENPSRTKAKKSNKNKRLHRSTFGYSERGYIGLELMPLNAELRRHFGGDDASGMLVARVEDNGPADRAGLKVGDLLVSVAGVKVRSIRQVARQIHHRKKGERVAVRRVRAGGAATVVVTLDRRKVPRVEVSRFIWTWPPRRPNGASPGNDSRRDEAFRDAMERFHQAFPRPDRAPVVPDNYFDYSRQKRQLEQRLKEMEKKLEKLEKRLQSSNQQ